MAYEIEAVSTPVPTRQDTPQGAVSAHCRAILICGPRAIFLNALAIEKPYAAAPPRCSPQPSAARAGAHQPCADEVPGRLV
jgi:hypothetical protein